MNLLVIIFIVVFIQIIYILYIVKKKGLKSEIINNVKFNIIKGDEEIDFRYDEVELVDNVYERNLSFSNNLNYIYWLAISYNIINNKTNLIGAFLTKWYKNGNIKIVDRNTKVSRILTHLKKKNIIGAYDKNGNSLIKNHIYIKFENNKKIDNPNERRLFEILKSSSVSSEINEDDFKNWLINKSNDLINWFNDVYDDQTNQLIKKEEISFKNDKLTVSNVILSDVILLNNYKNFLTEFNITDNKDIKYVHTYDSYLINSVLFGVNKKIKEELGDVYPRLLFDIKNILNKFD